MAETGDSLDADILIVGAGIAGLACALRCESANVVVLTKSAIQTGGASLYAQGGVAAAVGVSDSPELHAIDTITASSGLADARRVAQFVQEGPETIDLLVRLGARFDRDEFGKLNLGQEGAHNKRRIVHAQGDATGAELVRVLYDAVEQQPNIELLHGQLALDLAHDQSGSIAGLWVWNDDAPRLLKARAVVLATGGSGRLYRYTTNPPEATGDGLAMAARAGAVLVDLEFVQFHPTALDVQLDPLPLLSEALRGEGATLIDEHGIQFMRDAHPQGDLAPRDIVAREIARRLGNGHRVFLDTRDAFGSSLADRFPKAYLAAKEAGIDPIAEPMPVVPAAHYQMGGIEVDENGRTSLGGLWACGEVAATGIHGANRLASNSLLEALVYGKRTAEDLLGSEFSGKRVVAHRAIKAPEPYDVAQLRSMMWQKVGLIRNAQSLEDALRFVNSTKAKLPIGAYEAKNLFDVARIVILAALERKESRGAHYRSDYPITSEHFEKHLRYQVQQETGQPRLLEPVALSVGGLP